MGGGGGFNMKWTDFKLNCPVFDCESDRTKGLVTAGGGFLPACLLEKAGHCPPYVDM